MTKLRTPDSIEDAMMQAIALLGLTRICEITGRKPSQVKAWSNPDDDLRNVPLLACGAIDRELQAEGHERVFTPWLDTFSGRRETRVSTDSPLQLAIHCVTAAADTLEHTQAALADGVLDGHDRARLVGEVTKLRRQLGSFMRSLAEPGGSR